MTKKTLQFNFRWPIEKSGECQATMSVPMGENGTAIITQEFAGRYCLSDGELERAETAVIETVAIIK